MDPPTLLHTLSPQTLLLATDSSALYLYDLRADSTIVHAKPQQTYHPHDDFVSSLTPLPPTDGSTSGFSNQWVSTGGTTVAVTDLRRGILVKSEDQGEELLSSTVVNGKLVVGGERGGLRLWEIGVWDDNEETVIVGKTASADVLAAAPPEIGKEQLLAVGMDDGFVRFVGMGGKRPKLVGAVRHDEIEGVLGLGFEVGGRMCSGGGGVVQIWEETLLGDNDEDEQEASAGDDGVQDVGSEGDDSGTDEDDSEKEEKPKKRKKKKKRNKGKEKSAGQHVMAFKDMD